MAKCKKCEEFYITTECPRCKINEEPLSEKEKLFKIIRYAIIFFIGLFIIGGIAEIYVINKVVDIAQPTIENMNKMTNTMNKATEQMIRDMEKQMKI